jgi:hypothetical protein
VASFTASVPLNLIWQPTGIGVAPVTVVAVAGATFTVSTGVVADEFEAAMGPTVETGPYFPYRSEPRDLDTWNALQRGEPPPVGVEYSITYGHVVVAVPPTTNSGRIPGLTRIS